MTDSAAIVIGAGSSIGAALCKRWQQDNAISHVFAVSREQADERELNEHTSIHNIHCDYSEASIIKACQTIKTLIDEHRLDTISRVCICNGILHNEMSGPKSAWKSLAPATCSKSLPSTVLPQCSG